MSCIGVSTITDVPGEITCDSLLVGGTDINTIIDNKIDANTSSSSSETYVFVATVSATVTNFRADQNTILPYDKVNIDIGGGCNDSTYTYTIQKSGLYMFNASATTVSSSYIFRANTVHFNGTNETTVKQMSNTNRDVSDIINCSVDDYVYCAMINSSSTNRLSLNEYSYFTGHSIVLT